MEELLKIKLKAAKELKLLTKEIMELSLKTEYDKVNSMLGERQQFIEKINTINLRISEAKNNVNFIESKEIKTLNNEMKNVFSEIFETDNIIRKNINTELKDVKQKLNHPETQTNSLNLKA